MRAPKIPLATPFAFLLVGVVAFICAQAPLTGTPGAEAAQLLGIAGGAATAIAAAARGARRHEAGFAGDVLFVVVLAAAFLAIFAVATTIGAALHPSCAPSRGYLPFFFLGLPVVLLHGMVGAWIGRSIGAPSVAVVTTLFVLIGDAFWLGVDWWLEPSFRVLSHLFVVVDGDLLDGQAMTPSMVAFRGATTLFALALLVAGLARWPRARRAGLVGGGFGSPLLYAAALGIAATALVGHALAASAIVPDRTDLEAAYSLVKRRGPLVVHADPLRTPGRDVDAMLAEGALWLERLEVRLGQKPAQDVHVWLHPDRDAQARWTGAKNVDFTLPWRFEIHVASAQVPHRTLGHELAHVIAGQLTDSLFGVPSRYVVLTNPGITEGLAMAVTPELALLDGLTLREQAAAMRRSGIVPDLYGLFEGLAFWRESPSRAYVAAGALLETLAATGGEDPAAVLARLYQGGSLESVLGAPEAVRALVAEHEAALDQMVLPPDAVTTASRRFRRPSVLHQTCDPEQRARADAVRARAVQGDFDAAERAAADVEGATLADDTLAELYQLARWREDEGRALAYAQRKAGHAENDARARAADQERVGDSLWRLGRLREADVAWSRVVVQDLPPDQSRPVTAKRAFAQAVLAGGATAQVSAAALAFLLDDQPQSDRTASLANLARTVGLYDAAPTEEPAAAVELGRYVLARQLVQRGDVEGGGLLLARIVASGATLGPVFDEQVQLGLATASFRQGELTAAREAYEQLAEAAVRPAARLELRDRADRARRAERAPITPDDERAGDRWLLGIGKAGSF